MASDIDHSLRRFVAERAGGCCKYCLLHEEDAYSPHQIDHIVSRKHGGSSEAENLAYACLRCDAWKGSDLGSVHETTGRLIRGEALRPPNCRFRREAAGLLIALFAARLLAALLWGVRPNDPATFVSVAVLLILVAGTASLIPALRLIRLDPVQTLREE